MGVAAILLAGGLSSRMGGPKPLLEWGGATLIEYQVAQLHGGPMDETLVVLGHRARKILPYVQATARVIVNTDYNQGRSGSLRLGAAALPDDTETVLILNVDQPRPQEVIARLVAEHRRGHHLITVPTYQGRRGHPVVVSGRLLSELRQVAEETQGLREVLRRHAGEVVEVPFDTRVVLLDINESIDYEKARETYFCQLCP